VSRPADSLLQSVGQNPVPLLLTEVGVESFQKVWLSGTVIAALFFGVSLLSSAIPGINEPHYLCKARAFDDPVWCTRDFFLASANAHYCFFAVTGFLTRWLSLDAIALLGRSVSVMLLATGWTMLGRSLGLSAAWRILAACVFATISQLGSFSGEWLLGGFESKVPAWGLSLVAISFWIRGQMQCCPGWMTAAGVVCGVASSLHPVVGGWVAVCVCLASAWSIVAVRSANQACARRSVRGANNDSGAAPGLKPLIGIGLFSAATIVMALPGLIPALRLVLDRSNSQSDRAFASFYQVFWRLQHHLDPTELMPSQWIFAVILLGVIIVGNRWSRLINLSTSHGAEPDRHQMSAAWSSLLTVFAMAALIAIAGIAIGWHTVEAQKMLGWEWRASLLKFYPFRVFDALLPIVASFVLTRLLQSRLKTSDGKPALPVIGILIMSPGIPLALAWHDRESAPPGYTVYQSAEWRDACRWIDENTPTDSLVLTPRESFAFKWIAERAEYVCYKDCPQDTAGILTWNKRLWLLHDWTLKSSSDGRYDAADLKTLRGQTDCDYILTRILGPFDAEPLWQGQEWRIYSVPE